MTLAQPGWLILLVLLPLIGVAAIVVARLRQRQWQPFVASRLRNKLLRRSSPLPRWLALFFLIAACAALIGALTRPQGDAGTTTEKMLGRNVLIAMDISRSMRVSDVKPDRLAQAKVVIYEMLETMPEDRIGLIGFAGAPFLYAPLTIDHAAVRETVEQIDPEWAVVGGSDLAAAVKLATTTLKETGQKNNALVIISDGEEHEGDLDAMIREAESSGVYIFAIGVGTEDGGFVPGNFPGESLHDERGRPVLSRLQPDVLKKLATETGGRYAVAGSTMDIPQMVRAATQDLDAFEVQGRERRVMIEFYQWLLLPAIFFLGVSILTGTRWRPVGATAVLAACFFIAGSPTSMAIDAKSARQALDSGRFEEARDAYRELAESSRFDERSARFRLGEGTAAYRGGDFRSARSAFSESLTSANPEVRSNGHLGMGNSLFQLGWLGLTDESYPGDSQQPPDLDRFDTLVRERLAKMAEGEAPEKGETDGFVRFDSMILNWSDAIRHYQSALNASPDNTIATRNRETTMSYLKRLRDLLEEQKEETEQSMPEPQQGESPPQPQQGEPGEDEGEGEPQEGDGSSDPEGDPMEGEGGEDEESPADEGEEPEGEEGSGDEQEDETKNGNPNESEEDRARRLLKEHADLERGPLNPGRREFRPPLKDW